MKIKLVEVFEAEKTLKEILSEKIPFELSYRCISTLETIEKEISLFRKVNNELVIKLGEKEINKEGAETGLTKVKPENVQEYNKSVNELLEVEIDFDGKLIPYESLKPLDIAPLKLVKIKRFISEPGQEAK
jgi:hypothetical protein